MNMVGVPFGGGTWARVPWTPLNPELLLQVLASLEPKTHRFRSLQEKES